MSDITKAASIAVETTGATIKDKDGNDCAEVRATLTIAVPNESWIECLTQYRDIFGYDYCGSWMRGVAYHDERGWLCWEHGGEDEPEGFEEQERLAILAWEKGEPLPKDWYHLDRAAAINAYLQVCALWGLDWENGDHGDASGQNCAVQLALLGEIRY